MSTQSFIQPSLKFNFFTAQPYSQIGVSRSGATATRVNSSGVLETVSADTLRFDYDPVTLQCLGVLIEETRQNLFNYSSAFENAAWSKYSCSITTDTETAPNGTLTADKLIMNNGVLPNAASGFGVQRSLTASADLAVSVFCKAGEFDAAWFRNNATGGITTVSLVTGVIGGADASIFSVRQFKNGWFRITWRILSGQNTNRYSLRAGQTGDGSSGFFIWGYQVEAGAFPTSYIPTTTVAVTRNADVATITGTNFSSFWQATRGGVLVRARPVTVSDTRPWVQFDDNTADNIIALRGNTTNPELYVKAGGVDQAIVGAGTIAANTSYRLAGTWNTNDCAASLNGAAPVLDTSATIPAVTQMRLGSDGTNYLNGHIEAVEYYDQRLLGASLQVVSSPSGYRSIIGPVMRDTIIR